jgi:hypothetical protein
VRRGYGDGWRMARSAEAALELGNL